jgi:putative nucleotidyltransferase with HDIG domain
VRQRVRQLREATATPGESEWSLAREWLSSNLFDLFAAQHPRDIVHAANTARWLLEHGERDQTLIEAALLHDIGKGPQRRRDRILWVLADSVRAGRVAASPHSRFETRRAMERTRTHSASGAAMLERAGADTRTVNLTLHHHESGGSDPVLALLQRADAAS